MKTVGKMMMVLALLPVMSHASNISNKFDNRPVMPALKKMQGDWTWQNFASLPNTDKKQKDPESKSRYFISHGVPAKNETVISVDFYGTKDTPDVAVVEHRGWGAGYIQDATFIQLNKMKGLTPLKSNCNFKNISIKESGNEDGNSWESGANLSFQQVYQFKQGNKTLYMASSQVDTYVITSTFQSQAYTKSIITPHKEKLGTFINAYGWSKNKSGKTIKCTVS